MSGAATSTTTEDRGGPSLRSSRTRPLMTMYMDAAGSPCLLAPPPPVAPAAALTQRSGAYGFRVPRHAAAIRQPARELTRAGASVRLLARRRRARDGAAEGRVWLAHRTSRQRTYELVWTCLKLNLNLTWRPPELMHSLPPERRQGGCVPT